MTERLNGVRKLPDSNDLLGLKPGDNVMVHLDYGKTPMMFDKRRRQFDETGVFIKYLNGNCVIQMTRRDVPAFENPIEVPIFFVERLPDMDRIIHDTFNL